MTDTHTLETAADDGREILFLCHDPDCGRRLVLKRDGEMIVIDRGDFYALHVGAAGPITMTASHLKEEDHPH